MAPHPSEASGLLAPGGPSPDASRHGGMARAGADPAAAAAWQLATLQEAAAALGQLGSMADSPRPSSPSSGSVLLGGVRPAAAGDSRQASAAGAPHTTTTTTTTLRAAAGRTVQPPPEFSIAYINPLAFSRAASLVESRGSRPGTAVGDTRTLSPPSTHPLPPHAEGAEDSEGTSLAPPRAQEPGSAAAGQPGQGPGSAAEEAPGQEPSSMAAAAQPGRGAADPEGFMLQRNLSRARQAATSASPERRPPPLPPPPRSQQQQHQQGTVSEPQPSGGSHGRALLHSLSGQERGGVPRSRCGLADAGAAAPSHRPQQHSWGGGGGAAGSGGDGRALLRAGSSLRAGALSRLPSAKSAASPAVEPQQGAAGRPPVPPTSITRGPTGALQPGLDADDILAAFQQEGQPGRPTARPAAGPASAGMEAMPWDTLAKFQGRAEIEHEEQQQQQAAVTALTGAAAGSTGAAEAAGGGVLTAVAEAGMGEGTSAAATQQPFVPAAGITHGLLEAAAPLAAAAARPAVVVAEAGAGGQPCPADAFSRLLASMYKDAYDGACQAGMGGEAAGQRPPPSGGVAGEPAPRSPPSPRQPAEGAPATAVTPPATTSPHGSPAAASHQTAAAVSPLRPPPPVRTTVQVGAPSQRDTTAGPGTSPGASPARAARGEHSPVRGPGSPSKRRQEAKGFGSAQPRWREGRG